MGGKGKNSNSVFHSPEQGRESSEEGGLRIPPPLSPKEILHKLLPHREAMLSYHRAIEEFFEKRGKPLRIRRVMGKWELIWSKTK